MDLAILSSRIYTGNPAQPWAEALKIENECVTNVGSNAEVKNACTNTTEILDMPGSLVAPGVVDAHCHFVSLGLAFQLVNLSDASSLDEVRERIQKAAATRKPGDWIVGRGWNHHQWVDRREPTRRDLDDILPHVKLFADGSLGSGTALMHEPYTDDPTECGLACLERDVLEKKIRLAYSRGCDVAIHAIGDLALTNALESIAAARRDFPAEHRDRVEHVQIYRPQDLSLFRELGVVASVQPVFLGTDWAPAEKRWGPQRCRYAYAWKSLLQADLPVQFGSDAPVESINPLYGIHAAVTRQDRSGQPDGDGWFSEQKLSLEESIKGFTSVAAWNTRREDQLGFIAPGKWADLTVFEKDLFNVAPEQWRAVETALTVVHGEVVFRA